MKQVKVLIIITIIIILSGCKKNDFKIVPQEFNVDYIVTMEMENGKIIKIELYKEVAPITVENFVTLVNEGFY
ncbi:MAG: ppiB [Haloplasmataceae bacterium]|nr:ppiB [Haloplasmataceae bacterium]